MIVRLLLEALRALPPECAELEVYTQCSEGCGQSNVEGVEVILAGPVMKSWGERGPVIGPDGKPRVRESYVLVE